MASRKAEIRIEHGVCVCAIIYIDYFMVDECVRFLFTSCERLLRTSERSERVS